MKEKRLKIGFDDRDIYVALGDAGEDFVSKPIDKSPKAKPLRQQAMAVVELWHEEFSIAGRIPYDYIDDL